MIFSLSNKLLRLFNSVPLLIKTFSLCPLLSQLHPFILDYLRIRLLSKFNLLTSDSYMIAGTILIFAISNLKYCPRLKSLNRPNTLLLLLLLVTSLPAEYSEVFPLRPRTRKPCRGFLEEFNGVDFSAVVHVGRTLGLC